MNWEDAGFFLRKRKLQVTRTRQHIVLTLLGKETAISQKEILASTKNTCNRVTVYRTLAYLARKKIVHIVPMPGSEVRYAIHYPQKKKNPHLGHPHFLCTQCGATTCIPGAVPEPQLPAGFVCNEKNLIIKGVCKNCNK